MPTKWKICAVCGYPLENLVAASEAGWFHARPDWAEDHIAVPVDVGEVELNQRCDFCDEQPVTWIVLAEPHDMALPGPRQRSVGHWAACEQCARAIQADSWGRVITRAKRRQPDIPRLVFQTMYDELQRHVIGVIPRREWLPEEGLVDEDD